MNINSLRGFMMGQQIGQSIAEPFEKQALDEKIAKVKQAELFLTSIAKSKMPAKDRKAMMTEFGSRTKNPYITDMAAVIDPTREDEVNDKILKSMNVISEKFKADGSLDVEAYNTLVESVGDIQEANRILDGLTTTISQANYYKTQAAREAQITQQNAGPTAPTNTPAQPAPPILQPGESPVTVTDLNAPQGASPPPPSILGPSTPPLNFDPTQGGIEYQTKMAGLMQKKAETIKTQLEVGDLIRKSNLPNLKVMGDFIYDAKTGKPLMDENGKPVMSKLPSSAMELYTHQHILGEIDEKTYKHKIAVLSSLQRKAESNAEKPLTKSQAINIGTKYIENALRKPGPETAFGMKELPVRNKAIEHFNSDPNKYTDPLGAAQRAFEKAATINKANTSRKITSPPSQGQTQKKSSFFSIFGNTELEDENE